MSRRDLEGPSDCLLSPESVTGNHRTRGVVNLGFDLKTVTETESIPVSNFERQDQRDPEGRSLVYEKGEYVSGS